MLVQLCVRCVCKKFIADNYCVLKRQVKLPMAATVVLLLITSVNSR